MKKIKTMKNYLILDQSNNILAETRSIKEARLQKRKHKTGKIYWYYD